MNKHISKIWIDENNRLHYKIADGNYSMIYRLAVEINWDQNSKSIYTPDPIEKNWNYLEWYKHVIKVFKDEMNTELIITNETKFMNIPEELKLAINNLKN